MRVAVVGAGPAGVRAVEQLVAAGLEPVWLDEAADGGGRIYQRPPPPLRRDATELYGFEAARAAELHDAFDTLKQRVDWRPHTLVWNLVPRQRELRTLRDGVHGKVAYDATILCTGAMDRVVPIPGWTSAGVTTLGGAQIALKTQGCAIGRRVAFVGTGPLLWLVACQYAKAGASVAAVLDTTPFADKAAQGFGLVRGGATFAKGLYYMAWLRAHGVRVEEGITPEAIDVAGGEVTGIRWRTARGMERRMACDAVAMGWGLRPEAQLADLAGVPFRFDRLQHNWVPERDAAGRTPVPGVYLAGDGAGIGGADVAELAGARTALALLADAGRAVDTALAARLDRGLARRAAFRRALDRAFPFPAALAARMDGGTVLCRCEGITAGELRAAASATNVTGAAPEVNRAKAFTRMGMGRCQARVCAAAGAEVLCAALAQDVASVGRIRGQAPVKPIPITGRAVTGKVAPGEVTP